jgi:hypothetical protein
MAPRMKLDNFRIEVNTARLLDIRIGTQEECFARK